jgi:hypothetical protein
MGTTWVTHPFETRQSFPHLQGILDADVSQLSPSWGTALGQGNDLDQGHVPIPHPGGESHPVNG